MVQDKDVYIRKLNYSEYPQTPPFNPNRCYPEYPFKGDKNFDYSNQVYESIRNLLFDMGLDKENYDSVNWNPFSSFIKSGDTVLVKPNMVLHKNQLREFSVESVITNGSVIRAIVDYAYIALNGSGKIIIADAPIQSCDFDEVVKQNGLYEIKNIYSKIGFEIEIIDFRNEKAIMDKEGRIIGVEELKGDPRGYTAVDLKRDSMLFETSKDYDKFRVTNYDSTKMKEHHNEEIHEYLIPNTVLKANVVINLPKPKTHRKAGITASMKNLVGINGSKDWLPHHKTGSVEENGDEYLYKNLFKRTNVYLQEKIDKLSMKNVISVAKFFRLIQKFNSVFRKTFVKDEYLEGSWWGNDTIWRTVSDLNRLLIYADSQGQLQDTIQRNCISILDMIISGEKEGPLKPTPKKAGILVAGTNSLAIDTVVSRVMGMDYTKIPNIIKAYDITKYPLSNFKPEDIIVHSNNAEWNGPISRIDYENSLKFQPTSGWSKHIELEE